MDLAAHVKWAESDKQRQTPCDLTYMWDRKTKVKLPPAHKLTDTENRLVVAKAGGGGGRHGGRESKGKKGNI